MAQPMEEIVTRPRVLMMMILCAACGDDPRGAERRAALDGSIARDLDAASNAAPEGSLTSGDSSRSDGAGDRTPPSALRKAEACHRYFDAICARQVACGLTLETMCVTADLCPDHMFSLGSTWTVEAATACAAAWATMSCDDMKRDVRPACAEQNGTFALGRACVAHSQCASGYCDAPVISGLCGACAPILPRDSPCSGPLARCAYGQTCSDNRCVDRQRTEFTKPARQGERCVNGPTPPCEPGLGCLVASETATEGTCVPLPTLGQPCVTTFFSAGACAAGLSCNARPTGTCVKASAIGEACGFVACLEGGYCNTFPDAPGEPYTCQPVLAAGELCTRKLRFGHETGKPAPCAKDLECMYTDDLARTARCAKARDLGESCNDTTMLCRPGSSCLGGICMPLEDRGLYKAFCADAGVR